MPFHGSDPSSKTDASADATAFLDSSPPRRLDLSAGDSVGRYRIARRLGAGGMGVVYLAHDPELDRDVALKVFDISTVNREFQTRVIREARALARLSHPNVVDLYDAGTDDASEGGAASTLLVYIAMQFIDGVTLAQWMKTADRSWTEVLDVYAAAGRGLAAAHAAGLVHRDFKPANVMIANDGPPDSRVQVLDFGLARAPDSGQAGDPVIDPSAGAAIESSTASHDVFERAITRAGTVVGTPAYMAPEQHAGGVTDARTDQFSYCVALYEALFGKRPFSGSAASLVRNKRAGRFEPPPRSSPVPRRVCKAIERGLSPALDQRWPSMAALLDALSPRPKRVTWRGATVGAMASVALIGLVAWPRGDQPQCDAAGHVERVFGDARRDAIRKAMLDTKLPYAEHAWERLERAVDDNLGRWSARYDEVCTTNVADATADRTAACIRARLESLDAQLEVLAQADATVVERTETLIRDLPDLDACADETEVQAMPMSEEGRRIAAQLEKANARGRVARYDEQIALAESALADARALKDDRLVARALLTLGSGYWSRGDHDEAAKTLADAAWGAQAAQDDRTAALASIDLVRLFAARNDISQVETWSRHAEASMQRVEANERLRARFEQALGIAAGHEGRFEDSVEHHQRATELLIELRGADDVSVAMSRANEANMLARLGRFDDAKSRLEQTLAAYEDTFGPDHPRVAMALDDFAVVLSMSGESEAALPVMRRSLGISERALGPRHPTTLATRSNISVVLGELGRAKEAIAPAREVVEAHVELYGENHPKVAVSRMNLGRLLHVAGKLPESIAEYRHAVAILEAARKADHPELALARSRLGTVLVDADEPAEAIDLLESAIEVFSSGDDVFHILDHAEFSLARALWNTRRDRDRALELARAVAARNNDNEDLAREVETWLHDRPG